MAFSAEDPVLKKKKENYGYLVVLQIFFYQQNLRSLL